MKFSFKYRLWKIFFDPQIETDQCVLSNAINKRNKNYQNQQRRNVAKKGWKLMTLPKTRQENDKLNCILLFVTSKILIEQTTVKSL